MSHKAQVRGQQVMVLQTSTIFIEVIFPISGYPNEISVLNELKEI